MSSARLFRTEDRTERARAHAERTDDIGASSWREDGSADGRMERPPAGDDRGSAGSLSRVRFAEPGVAAAGKSLFRGDDR
jgi:hypothetical protein